MWATTTTKKRLPPLKQYLIADEAVVETPASKAAALRAAMHVLSAQYGLPLRVPVKKERASGE